MPASPQDMRAAVLAALSEITDPLKPVDIVAAGRVASVDITEGVAQIALQIPPPDVEKFFPIRDAAQAAIAALDGITKAGVVLSAHKPGPTVNAPRRGNPHKPRRPEGVQGDRHIKQIIAISSAKGGVGKSTVCVQLAISFARSGLRVGVLDADIHGPSLPLLLGLSGTIAKTTEVEGRKLIQPETAHGVTAMSIGFLTPEDGPIVWRGPMVQGAMSRMLWDVNWGELDVLLIDMPPGTGDPQLGLAQDIKPGGAVIISTPQDLALLDARKGVQMFAKVDIPVMGLIENMAGFTCPDCGTDHAVFGAANQDHAKALGLDYLGALPLSLSMREIGAALSEFDALAQQLAAQIKNLDPRDLSN